MLPALRCFAFDEASSSNKTDGFHRVHSDVEVVCDPVTGLVNIRRETYEREEKKSFYVCDDEKSIAIVDLLEYTRCDH